MATESQTEQPGEDQLRKRVLLAVIFTVFLDMVGFGIVIPLLPLYVDDLGASKLTVGLILTSFSVAQLVATPILGRLSDRLGRRRIILLSLVGNAVAMLIFAYASHRKLLLLFFLSRILAGATAGNLSACQAAIADVTSRSERAAAMGRLGAGIGLGMVLGPVVGGMLSDIRWLPPVAASAMALCDIGVTAIFMPETLRSRRASSLTSIPPAPPSVLEPAAGLGSAASPRPLPSVWVVLGERRMASVLALTFLTFLCMTNIQVALALLAKERMAWGPKQVGFVFGLFGCCALVIQGGLIGRLVRTFGEIQLIITGAACNAIGMLMIGFSRSAWTLIPGLVLFGVGVAITNPSLASIASRLARDEQQGAVLGFAQSAGTLARTIGPTWSGFLYETFSSATAPFMSGAIAAIFSFVIGLTVRDSLTSTGDDAQAGGSGPQKQSPRA